VVSTFHTDEYLEEEQRIDNDSNRHSLISVFAKAASRYFSTGLKLRTIVSAGSFPAGRAAMQVEKRMSLPSCLDRESFDLGGI
jgi:hypothetical protein